MIKIENTEVLGWEHAIRGMRNPMNSWERSDSSFYHSYDCDNHCSQCGLQFYGCSDQQIGPNDHDLMLRLARAGSVHGKFRRMITVHVDITAPLYWWKEFDTYKVGTVANSCSTMHKIHEKEFTLDDFSCEHLIDWNEDYTCDCLVCEGSTPDGYPSGISPIGALHMTIAMLNKARELYLEARHSPSLVMMGKAKQYWWQMIQLLPSSYNQKRTVMLNYEVLANIYKYRKDHKLDEWRNFCGWIDNLPYSEIITCGAEEEMIR